MEARFELEAVTPLFIAGADQRWVEGEGLRSPTLRGLLRWWFRTAFKDPRPESKVFGGRASGRAEGKKSDVVVKSAVRSQRMGEVRECVKDAGYLFFSMQMQKRPCYIPGSRFEVFLSSRSEESFKMALASLWLLLNLGGVGSRNRRGAGSLSVLKASPQELHLDSGTLRFIPFPPTRTPTRIDYPHFLKQGLKVVREFAESCSDASRAEVEIGGLPGTPQLAPTPTLHPRFLSIFVKRFNSSQEALRGLEEWLRGIRRRMSDPSFVRWLRFGGGRAMAGEQRVFFGLPLQYHFRNKRCTLEPAHEDFKRRASPVMLGVFKSGREYWGRVLIWKSKFHPARRLKVKESGEEVGMPDDFSRFLRRLEEDLRNSGWKEVTGW